MLIDFSLIPTGVASSAQIGALNDVHTKLTLRLVDQIVIPEGKSGFRPSNLIRVYLHSHLRRMLQLSECALSSYFDGQGVVAMLCGRALYESIGTVADFEMELLPLLDQDDIQKIFDFTKSKIHATKLKNLIEQVGNPNVTAKNVVTMVKKLTYIRENVPKEYDFLSEIAHPNGIGAVGFFASITPGPPDIAHFSDSGPDVHADLQWVLIAVSFLREFEKIMSRIEEKLPALTARGEEQWLRLQDKPGRGAN